MDDIEKETFATWNAIAGLYEEKFMNFNLYDETYDLFCDLLNNQKAKLLEVACGPGNITKYLLSKHPGYNILAIDTAPNMIALAKKNNPTANFNVMDARAISTLQQTFDGIVCGFCLPFLSIKETEKLIADSSSMLPNNGVFYLSFMADDPSRSGFKTASTGHRTYFRYHELQKIKSDLAHHQFQITKLFHINYSRSVSESEIHTVIVAQKIP